MKADAAPRFAGAADLARITDFNRTARPFPETVTLQELIEQRVRRHADETAVLCDNDDTFGGPRLTYREVNERANQLAHRLRAEGVGPGSVVALTVERSFAMILGIFAVLKAGGAYLPIAPGAPPERTAYMLADGGVRVLLVRGGGGKAVLEGFGGRVIDLADPGVYRGSTRDPEPRSRAHDLAYVIYTSGSTGRPKGVMVEHRSVVNRLHWMQHAYPIGPGDVVLQKTPYTFDVSVWELFWWAIEGAALAFLAPGREGVPLAILDAVRRHRASVLHFVPSMLDVFLESLAARPEAVAGGLASVRRVFASGEALTPGHVRKFNEVWGSRTGARLTNLYGPTEATVDVSWFDCPPAGAPGAVPIGRPIHNTRLYVMRDGRHVAVGETGELCIAGVGLARGYLNNPALTAERFTDNPASPGERIYRTGDLARWLEDGTLEYLGREDQQVKIRGLRIELGEIESAVRDFPGIGACVAVVRRYSETVVLIVAYVVSRSEVDVEGLRRHLRRRLPDYMIPHQFERIERIPVTPSGKADRSALPEPGPARRSGTVAAP